jgi:hypothetical protein
LPKEIKEPVFAQSSTDDDEDCEDNHEAEEYFGEVVKLLICFPHFLTGIMRIHNTPHLSACIHNDSNSSTVGQKAVSPKGIIQIETFTEAIVLGTCFYFKNSLKVIDIQLWRLCFDCGEQPNEVALTVILQVMMSECDSFS